VERLIESWTIPHVMPPIATVLEFVREVAEVGPRITDARYILDRGDKPPDWEPLKAGEFDAMKRESRARATEFQKQFETVTAGKGMR